MNGFSVKIRTITQKISNTHGYVRWRICDDVGLYWGLSTNGPKNVVRTHGITICQGWLVGWLDLPAVFSSNVPKYLNLHKTGSMTTIKSFKTHCTTFGQSFK